MIANCSQKFNNSSSSTTTTAATSTASATAAPDTATHRIIIALRDAGIVLSPATLRVVRTWITGGLQLDTITGYIIPETVLAVRPSLRYADAIARRLIRQKRYSLAEAQDQRQQQAQVEELPDWYVDLLRSEGYAIPKPQPRSRISQLNYSQRDYPEHDPSWLEYLTDDDQPSQQAR